MPSFSSVRAAVVGLALSSVAAALPENWNVTKLVGGCEVWPQYDAASGIAGPWTISASNTDSELDNNNMGFIYAAGPDHTIAFGRV